MRNLIQFASLAIFACSARAQLNTIDIVASNIISPAQPSTVVEAWAVWDPDQYAFWKASFNFFASEDSGGFSNPERLLKGPESRDGVVEPGGDAVTDVRPLQLHFPAANIFADTANPILIWRVTWSTSDFSPRFVDLHTSTTEFALFIRDDGLGGSFIDDFTEGSGAIQVVPAPAPAAVLALAAPWMRRRR